RLASLLVMIRLNVFAHSCQRCKQHSNIIGKANHKQQIGNEVEGKDKIGQRREKNAADTRWCLAVECAIIGCDKLLCEGNVTGSATEDGPETTAHLLLTTFVGRLAHRCQNFTNLDIIHTRSPS